MAETGKTASRINKVAAKPKVVEVKPGVPINLWLKIEPTDLLKYGPDVQVTLLAGKRAPKPIPKPKPKPKPPQN